MNLSLNKDKIRFLLLEGVHDNALNVLNEAGYTNIEYIKTALDEDELIENQRCPLYRYPLTHPS